MKYKIGKFRCNIFWNVQSLRKENQIWFHPCFVWRNLKVKFIYNKFYLKHVLIRGDRKLQFYRIQRSIGFYIFFELIEKKMKKFWKLHDFLNYIKQMSWILSFFLIQILKIRLKCYSERQFKKNHILWRERDNNIHFYMCYYYFKTCQEAKTSRLLSLFSPGI